MSVYLVDGYNLMHQILGHHVSDASALDPATRAPGGDTAYEAQGGGTYSIADLEDERKRLIDQIASFMGVSSDRAIVVFDSHSQALQKSESATANVEVFFGSFSRSADAIIEREVYALHAGETVIVVTSDYGLQKVIFRPNVVRRSSRQFVIDLQGHTKTIANRGNCITMGNRVEDRIATGTLDKLKALREALEKRPE